MAVVLSAKYQAEIVKAVNKPDVIVSIELDSGTIKIGYNTHFVDVIPALDKPSSQQAKIDAAKGHATLGTFTFQIIGRDNFKDLIQDEYLKNRRVTKYEGFVADGFTFSDYVDTYTGIISNWTRTGDVLTVTVADDLQPTTKKFPLENDTKTQSHDYSNTNIVDVMTNLILTQAAIPSARVDSAQFISERDTWLVDWPVQRILVKPEDIKKHLNDLQESSNSFIIPDGAKVSYKVFAPPIPGQTIIEFRDLYELLPGVSQDSGYFNRFYTRVVIYYNYDESGDDKEKNYESVSIVSDSDAESSSQWDETTTKTIMTKWIKDITFIQPTNFTGCVIYHISKENGINFGLGGSSISYNSTTKLATWEAPDGTTGDGVKVDKDGRYTLYDADRTKYIRIVITASSLPGSNQSDTIDITSLPGANMVTALAKKWLNRYRDPVAVIDFKADMNNISNGGNMWKPTDLIKLTTDEAAVFGKNTLSEELMMLLTVRPDSRSNDIKFSAIQTKIIRRYGFIGPSSITSDYPAASEAEREYAFIGDNNNKVNAGTEDGYYIW